jgi:hypothetical protein
MHDLPHGYGWEEYEEYDYTIQENVDCLACHADMSVYSKGEYGDPAEGVDLLAAARSVRAPTRDNCGTCHFDGGGGNGVKHGDLDESLYFPSESLDIHMGGGNNMLCTDCHWTEDHQILGRMLSDNYTIDPAEQVSCEQCHVDQQHGDERIDGTSPQSPARPATSPRWRSKTRPKCIGTGHRRPRKDAKTITSPISRSKVNSSTIKTSRPPTSGTTGITNTATSSATRQRGRRDLHQQTCGQYRRPNRKDLPLQTAHAKQPYDTINKYLLAPITAGENGFWTTFDWDSGFELAEERMGLPYSGQFGFAETYMYWPTTHMVQSADKALQCDSCHSENGRMDWEALGYPGDPIKWGGRK